MKRIALLLGAFGVFATANAQTPISITGTGLSYSQNFDALDTAAYSAAAPGSTNLPAGWSIFEYGTSTTRVNNGYVGESGLSNTGDTYSYGATGSTERALGSLASGSVASHYGVKFVNNTGATITGFTVRYIGEQWRMGATARTNQDTLRFLYSTSASGVSDTTSAYVVDNGLTLTTPNMSATGGAIDGNASGNNTVKSGTISGLTIANGNTVVIKWIDPNVAGSDDGLAVDSFSITFTLGGPASPRPVIVGQVPANNATGVAAGTSISFILDRQVTKGTGNIYIKNRNTQATTTIAAASSNVVITSGRFVNVSGTGIVANAVYHVTIDSTAFDTAGYKFVGLYDTTAWKFNTNTATVTSLTSSSLPIAVVNPAYDGTFIISATIAQAAVLNVRIYDLNGRELKQQAFNAVKGDNRMTLHTLLPAGTYLIRVDDGKEWGSVKATLQ